MHKNSVFFLGQVKDISGLLSACDIGILSTPNEGLPNVVLEYMAAGLPVVVSNIPGNREALGENVDEQFYIHGDPESLAAKLKAMITKPELRQKMGDRNKRRVTAEFSISKMCNKTTDIIKELL